MAEEAAVAWPLAIDKISAATGQSPAYVRAFLDDLLGTFFAASVQSRLAQGEPLSIAIDETVKSWMRWRLPDLPVDRQVFPSDEPSLTSFVRYCGQSDRGSLM